MKRGISALSDMEREVPRAELQARPSAKKVETISMNHTVNKRNGANMLPIII